GFGLLIRVGRRGICPHCPRRENHSNDPPVLLFSLIRTNNRPAGAVPNQNDLGEASLTGEVDPRGDGSSAFTPNTPVATAPQPRPVPVAGNITNVMHASIYRDTRVPEIREGPPDSDVCR